MATVKQQPNDSLEEAMKNYLTNPYFYIGAFVVGSLTFLGADWEIAALAAFGFFIAFEVFTEYREEHRVSLAFLKEMLSRYLYFLLYYGMCVITVLYVMERNSDLWPDLPLPIGIGAFVLLYLILITVFEKLASTYHDDPEFRFADSVHSIGGLKTHLLGGDDLYSDGYHVLDEAIYFKLAHGEGNKTWEFDIDRLTGMLEAEHGVRAYSFTLRKADINPASGETNDDHLGSLGIVSVPIETTEFKSESAFIEAVNASEKKLFEAMPEYDLSDDEEEDDPDGILKIDGKFFSYASVDAAHGIAHASVFAIAGNLYQVVIASSSPGEAIPDELLNTFFDLKVRGWRSMSELSRVRRA
jgi:hypothetical protein